MLKVVQREVKRTRPAELVRDYITDSLYNLSYGYFNKNIKIVPVGEQLDLCQLKNQTEYQKRVQKAYGYDRYVNYQDDWSKFMNRWHTPSEIFYPHYGHAIAKRILSILQENPHILTNNEGKLCIIEIGAGNGALCQSMLECFQLSSGALVHDVEYHLVDISASFFASFVKRLEGKFETQCHFHNWSFLEHSRIQQAFSGHAEKHWFILGFELLDNLGHDKISYAADGTLLQCIVESNDHSKFGDVAYRERYVEAEDPLILDLAHALDAVGYKSPALKWHASDIWFDLLGSPLVNPQRTEFLPTGMHQLLLNITYNFPKHTLLLGDFYYLPERVAGWNGPLVQSCLRGETIAVKNYLVKRGLFDIMFETNFSLLHDIYRLLVGQIQRTEPSTRVYEHAEFMKKYADLEKTRLKNGYNPLLHEFSNIRYFEGHSQPVNNSHKHGRNE